MEKSTIYIHSGTPLAEPVEITGHAETVALVIDAISRDKRFEWDSEMRMFRRKL